MMRAFTVFVLALMLAACGDSGGGGGGSGGAEGMVGGPGTTLTEGLPPITDVWFGTAYDAATMNISTRPRRSRPAARWSRSRRP